MPKQRPLRLPTALMAHGGDAATSMPSPPPEDLKPEDLKRHACPCIIFSMSLLCCEWHLFAGAWYICLQVLWREREFVCVLWCESKKGKLPK